MQKIEFVALSLWTVCNLIGVCGAGAFAHLQARAGPAEVRRAQVMAYMLLAFFCGVLTFLLLRVVLDVQGEIDIAAGVLAGSFILPLGVWLTNSISKVTLKARGLEVTATTRRGNQERRSTDDE